MISELARIAFRGIGGIALVLLLSLVVAGFFAPVLAPFDPAMIAPANRLSNPSSEHLLGTDHLGRDLLSRLLYGSRYSLTIALASVAFSTTLGIALGTLAGLQGSLWESVGMRFVDALMVYPTVLLALFFVATMGAGTDKVILALGFATLPEVARVTRAEVLRLRELSYIEAASALGAGRVRLAIRHILINGIGPILVVITYNVGRSLLAESTLGFLGVGAELPTWGRIVGEGRQYMREAPWAILFGGGLIMLSVLSVNLIGDTIRDSFDPTVAKK